MAAALSASMFMVFADTTCPISGAAFLGPNDSCLCVHGEYSDPLASLNKIQVLCAAAATNLLFECTMHFSVHKAVKMCLGHCFVRYESGALAGGKKANDPYSASTDPCHHKP
jgi:hypothetical protein